MKKKEQFTVANNMIWRLLERFGAQGVTFLVSLVLARLLDPDVYGAVALATIVVSILQVFVDSGLGSALIQKKNADDLDFSTVFFFNITFCVILYVLLYVLSPYISKIYRKEELTPVFRVLGIILLISGVKNIQHAYVSRNLLFKKFFFATLTGTIGAAVIGIIMAYKGYGVWALVAQYLFNAAVDTIILWIIVPWRPTSQFSFQRLKGLLSFGWKLLVSSLLDKVWTQLRQIIIGIKYTTEDLAFYNKGNEFPQYATTAINSSIDSVLLPVMSKSQDDKQTVKQITRRAIKTSSYIMWPVMMGIVACAEPLISVLIKDKWLFCVPYLRIFCLTYAFYPIHTANLNAIKALGRSDIFLILEIMKKVVGLIIIISSMWFGVFAMALSTIASSFFSQLINSYPNKRFLDYGYLEQIKDIAPTMFLSIIMAGIVYLIQYLNMNNLLTLLLQIIVGALIYIFGSILLKFDSYDYCKRFLMSLIRKGK